MKTKPFNQLIEGQDYFRFNDDPEYTIRKAVQVGKTEIYCPHQDSAQYDPSDVYLKSDKEVILIDTTVAQVMLLIN